jgi:hypothetical protein
MGVMGLYPQYHYINFEKRKMEEEIKPLPELIGEPVYILNYTVPQIRRS